MVLRILTIVYGLLGFVYSQNLFFTDSYQTNLYEHNQNVLIFNNNVFELLDDSSQLAVDAILQAFFEENNIDALAINTKNKNQLAYSFSLTPSSPLSWSKSWHRVYDKQLVDVLNAFLVAYFDKQISLPSSLKNAAILKLAYYTLENFKDRSSDFTKTSLQITLRDFDVLKFKQKNIKPNLSLLRIVTNSFGNFYNDSYPVEHLDKTAVLVYGPSYKARLKDCFSMHLFTKINQNSSLIYLTQNSVIVMDSLYSKPLINEDLIRYKAAVKEELSAAINSIDNRFYNHFDKEDLERVIKAYKLEDFDEFVQIYLFSNSYNIVQPLANSHLTFNKQLLNASINFKVNAATFESEIDTLMLNSLALFLNNNVVDDFIIIGYSKSTEYEKIDKKNFKKYLTKYKDFPPVQSSRKANLSLLRAVVVFDYLAEKGVDPSRMNCLSKTIKANYSDYYETNEALEEYSYAKFKVN